METAESGLQALSAGPESRASTGRAQRLLGRRYVPAAVVALALLLVSPALGVGPVGDDFMHMARVDPRLQIPGFEYAPLDLFTFVSRDPAQRAVLVEQGVFGWWTAPDFQMAFWRPLSSLTHVLDHRLRPRSAVFAHAHSLLWFAALLAVLAALYRRFHTPWVAHLALVLYALDDARGWVLGWNANRNALVAATFAFAALLAHDRARRDGWRAGRWLAPALFALALLGGESALAVVGYLVAHAVWLDSGTLGRRLARLWPYLLLSAAWLAAYRALGFGTSGGGWYVNPFDEPLVYLRALLERLPVLLAAQFGAGFSDLWFALPLRAQVVLYALALLFLAGLAALLLPVWRRSPSGRFWVTGTVLSLPPVCATFPMDRLLVFASVGAMGAVALLFAEWRAGQAFTLLAGARRRGVAAALALLALTHLALAPLLLPLRVLLLGYLASMGQRLDAGIPRDAGVREKTVVLVSSAAEMTSFPVWMQRHVQGVPQPRRTRVLASCFGDLQVTRVDPTTLRIRPQRGFLDNGTLRMVRGPSRPFRVGEEVELSDLRVLVRKVTADGRPAEVDFRFGVPLEAPSLLWRRLHAGGGLSPWAPPAVGESVSMPSVDPGHRPGDAR